jgi:hypothetical protein
MQNRPRNVQRTVEAPPVELPPELLLLMMMWWRWWPRSAIEMETGLLSAT